MPPSQSLIPRKRNELIATSISAFESEVSAVVIRTTPYSQHAILHAIGGMIVLAIVLAGVIPIDAVVTSVGGRIATREGPLYVQPFQQAIVRKILVKVGDIVKKGQVLATLDPTFTDADVSRLRDHFASDEAQIDRLEAERDGRPYVSKGDGKYQKLQFAQWQQRQKEYKQTIAGYDAQIASTRALLQQAQHDVANYTTRDTLNGRILQMREALARTGSGSNLLALQAQDSYTEIHRLLADARQQVAAQTANLKNLAAQKSVYIDTWADYVANNLVTVRNDFDQTAQDLAKAEKMNQLTSLVAPEDAVVLQIASASSGSVVNATTPSATSNQQQPLFTLTPLQGPTLATIDIDSGDIAFIRVGDSVILKVEAFPFVRFGSADGVVKTISDGSFTQEDDGTIRPAFFKVWVQITKLNFHNVPPGTRLTPGMTVEGDIKVNKRTALSYLYESFIRNVTEAMREP
jgi:membrane fusion protein, hemolysin D